jgi:hypothetical protein
MPDIAILSRYTGERIAGGEYADLRSCVIALVKSGANLSYADLSYADLSYADLSYADLSYADLSYASLSYASLSRANLSYASLSRAELSGAKLSDAKLSGANLSDANLSDANLSHASLSGANLSRANLSDAVGIVELPVGDPRGYRCFAVQQTDGTWRVFAGCRGPMTGAQAREHWGPSYAGDREIGDRYLHGLRWFGRRLRAERARSGR